MNAPFRTALDAPAGELVWLEEAMIDQVVAYSRQSPRGRMIAPFHRSADDPLHRNTDNTRSRRVVEKLGMQLDGVLRSACERHGQRKDEAIYSLLRGEWQRGSE